MAAGTALGLLVIIGVFSVMGMRMTADRLMATAESEASKASDTIKFSIESAMLSGNRDLIATVIHAIGQKPLVKDIRVLDVGGRVVWARDVQTEGKLLDRKTDPSCRLCHEGSVAAAVSRTVHFTAVDGDETIRIANPIVNKPECHRCHDAQAVLIGKLIVDVSASDVEMAIREIRRALLISGGFMLIVALCGIWVLFNGLIRRPLALLLEKMRLAGAGDLSVSVPVSGHDEIAELGAQFNDMVAEIRESGGKLQRRMDEMQTLYNVAEILYRSDSIEEAGELIISAMSLGFDVQAAAIMVFDPSTGALRAQTSVGMTPELVENVRAYVEATPAVRQRLGEGKAFVCGDEDTCAGGFLAVPLKAARKSIGVITVHAIKGRGVSEEDVVRLLTVVATEVAPHFLAAMQIDAHRAIKAGPFVSFVEAVEEGIAQARQYHSVLTIGVVRIENYAEVCASAGAEAVSELAQRGGSAISGAVRPAHSTVRVSEDTFAVLMPMTDPVLAAEMIEAATGGVDSRFRLSVRVVSYPEDAGTALGLVHVMGRGRA